MSSVIYRGNLKLALDHLALAHRLEKQGDAKLARKIRDRARELDPSLRPRVATDSAMALDAATENAIIERAIRTAKRATRLTSTRTTMPSRPYKPLDLSHIRSNRSGERFAQFMTAWRNPSLRKRQATHALDAEPNHKAALELLERARTHVTSVRSGTSDFDRKRFEGYLRGALEAMQGGAEDEDDPEPEHDSEGRAIPTNSAVVGGRRYVGDRRRAADSALTSFDPIRLFQRAP